MFASTSAMPHMPMPPMPTKWILVSTLRNMMPARINAGADIGITTLWRTAGSTRRLPELLARRTREARRARALRERDALDAEVQAIRQADAGVVAEDDAVRGAGRERPVREDLVRHA